MQFQPAFGKSILLGASICSLLSGCAVTEPMATGAMITSGPLSNGPLDSGPIGSPWEDPCSPDWPSACMPGPFSGQRTPLLDCLARLPHRQGLPDAPPYPRFHPLPTRPMFSPAVAPQSLETDEPPGFAIP